MSRTISLTVSDEEYVIIRHSAKSKGSTPSRLTKIAIFSYINKYPSKGVFALLDEKYQKDRETP